LKAMPQTLDGEPLEAESEQPYPAAEWRTGFFVRKNPTSQI
jgi:hypothetical protein